MRKLYDKWKEMCQWKHAREGSSMVSVIIGVIFLVAIGLIMLTAATRYVSAVYVDRNSTDNFYQTEGILEEVRTGLVQYANESADDAYRYILDHYLNRTTETKKNQFAKMFLTLMTKKLKGEIIPDVETQSDAFGNLFTKPVGVSTDFSEQQKKFFDDFDSGELDTLKGCGSNDANLDCVRNLSTKPECVKLANGKTEYEYLIEKDAKRGYILTLKNLFVDYTDASGYRSTIETDIVMTVPDYKFDGDSTIAQLHDYISVSDDTLTVNASTAETRFVGNIYAGTSLSDKKKAQGIKIAQNALVTFHSQKMISRGNLDILPGSSVNLTGESGAGDLWLNNIRLTYDGGVQENMQDTTNFTMNENAYIANDLDIATDNTVVNLSGKYYGYSYSKENDLTDAQQSDYSSAILVNGKNTWLNADGLQKMILAGRTFVSRKNADGSQAASSDIMMGESLAVKSNQLAYLVPDKYIKPYAVDGTEAKGQNMEGHNPVSASENVKILKDELLSDFSGLLDTNEPYTMNYSNTIGDKGYVFYYLNFKDAQSANKYFEQYYTDASGVDEDGLPMTNKELLDERAKVYISDLDGSGMKLSPSLYLIAANIVHNFTGQQGSSLLAKGQGEDYFDNTGTPKSELLSDGKKYGHNYVGLQESLVTSASGSSMHLDETTEPLVADKIIDTDRLETKTVDVPSEYTPGVSGAKIQMIASSSGEVDVPVAIQEGLVIAGKNVKVTVENNFTGLILSAGKVTIPNAKNPTLTSDMILIDQVMEYIKQDEELSKIFKGLNGKLTDNPTDASKCVEYYNWKKNEVQ